MLARNLLRWLGHVCRIDDRPVKEVLHGDLPNGSRPVCRPYLRQKDTCKMLRCGDALNLWMAVLERRQEWRTLIRTVCESDDTKRMKEGEGQREKRRQINHDHKLS